MKPAKRKSIRWMVGAGVVPRAYYDRWRVKTRDWKHCSFCGEVIPPDAAEEKGERDAAQIFGREYIPLPRPDCVCGLCYPQVLRIESEAAK